MANVYYWLGDATDTTATVLVRSDTAGTLTVTGGTATPVAVDPATEYGVAKLTVTGLSAGTSYPLTVLLDGVSVCTPTVRTLPTSGAWTFGWGSCVGQNNPQHYGYQLVRDHDIRLWLALGDTPYCDEAVSSSTIGAVAQRRWQLGAALTGSYTGWSSGRATWDYTYEYLQQTPGWEYLTQRVPTYRIMDDHEFGNDWDWSTANVSGFSPAITLQADVDTCGGYAVTSYKTWAKGNPSNSDPEIGNLAPSSCADAASNHTPTYFRKRICDVEFFVIDCYGHTDPAAKADPLNTICIDNPTWNAALGYSYNAATAKTRLGHYQLNWLLTNLAASTATFKVIVSGKTTYFGNAKSNNHGLNEFVQERNYILAWIKRYVTGVLWVAGDVHTPSVFNDISGHACVNSSPLGQATWLSSTGVVGYYPGYTHPQMWRANGHSGASSGIAASVNAYGVVEVTAGYLHPQVYSESETLIWEGYLLAGENTLRPTLSHRSGEWA